MDNYKENKIVKTQDKRLNLGWTLKTQYIIKILIKAVHIVRNRYIFETPLRNSGLIQTISHLMKLINGLSLITLFYILLICVFVQYFTLWEFNN